ncbi:hypothetical protein HMJ29_01425 [Hymenobacter taeanensis]|jgi:hypothetical protein|uniref:Uncharacterized protein n=1 Tax=Hymenobacter taeanensis TaxID=2735321 RepID=A0A6M6BBT3_9BACT|nr:MULTISPECIES: hypothetical protein [Hymenobacter]QJX45666.1 hypothetical protein HMJ29_01425 [Hymenobacter taeanensis]UOQ79502.1 hypothetical protein MUN83_11620 [Hymenobacter sp. 5414T-23]
MDHAARIEETIQGIYHAFEHPGQHPADSGLTAIDNWIQALDGLGGSALAGLQGELRNLRGHVQNDDRPAIANSLQHLGQETSLMARNMHDGVGDHLRHLGQVLITAAGNLKMS